MTTATATKEFYITIPYTGYTRICVERDANITEEELLASVTRDELVDGEETGDTWSSLKDSWREAQPGDLTIEDEYDEPLFQD